MNKLTSIMIVLCLMCCCSACGEEHVHKFSNATCVKAQTCECGETRGSALGHDYLEATCTDAKTCSRCEKEKGDPLGHDFKIAANCVKPTRCVRCDAEQGKPLGHEPTEATCTEDGICLRCGEAVEMAPGHSLSAESCTEDQICTVCNEVVNKAPGHDFVDNICTRCEEVDPESLPTPLTALPITEHLFYSQLTGDTMVSDTVGNTYTTENLFEIGSGGAYSGKFTPPFATYYLGGKYTGLTLTIAVKGSSWSSAAKFSILDGNDNVLYETGTITRQFVPQELEIDVTGLEWIKFRLVENNQMEDNVVILMSDATFVK